MSLCSTLVKNLERLNGLDGHVYALEAIKNAKPPFLIYLQVDDDEEQSLDGCTGLLSARFEVSVVHKTFSSLSSLSAAVKTTLNSMNGVCDGGVLIEHVVCKQASPDLYESEVNLYRRVYDLAINYQEVQ